MCDQRCHLYDYMTLIIQTLLLYIYQKYLTEWWWRKLKRPEFESPSWLGFFGSALLIKYLE